MVAHVAGIGPKDDAEPLLSRETEMTSSPSSPLQPRTPRVAVIMPSFGEGESLKELLPEMKRVLDGSYDVTVLLVNDLGRPDPSLEELAEAFRAAVVDTPYNMGSQEAIVHGIREQVRRLRADYVVTMDADGQDDVRSIPSLLAEVRPGVIAVARRTGRRPEGRSFRVAYAAYKWLFRVLTSVTPDFGNYAAFDQEVADHIARSPHFYVTYSLALPKVGRIMRVPVPRLPRRSGRSHVGMQGLFDHAVRSALPYLNVIGLRTAVFSVIPATVSVLLTLVSSFLRLFMPQYAFPNWATTIAFGAATLALQLVTICLLLFLVASLSRQIAASRAASASGEGERLVRGRGDAVR